MTPPLDLAVENLSRVLADENTALNNMDFAGAGALLAPKHAAADALAAAMRASTSSTAEPAMMRELGELADENRRLLNRAMRVQRRVLDLVARAARASQPSTRYGASGKYTANAGPRSVAKRV
jgi:hypothetical protein